MADTSTVSEIRGRVDHLLAARHAELRDRVARTVAEVLAVDATTIDASSSLIDDLGAESIDFLDLVFRLESEFGVKIPRDGILATVRSGLDVYDRKGVLTDEALDRMRVLMPEVSSDRLKAGLRTTDVPHLFTVETFVRLVAWRLADAAVV
jgi:acyl carrier protein